MAGDCPDCRQGWTVNADFTDEVIISDTPVPRYSGEFWTSGQRKGSSLHEISYRACFKPQLPAFFIRQLTHEGDLVYDPFVDTPGASVGSAPCVMERLLAGNYEAVECFSSPSPDLIPFQTDGVTPLNPTGPVPFAEI